MPSPTVVSRTPLNLSKRTALCPPSTVYSDAFRRPTPVPTLMASAAMFDNALCTDTENRGAAIVYTNPSSFLPSRVAFLPEH